MSPPTNTTIPWQTWQDALELWAREATGLTVVWAKQGGNPPLPRMPFVLLDVLSITRRGLEDGRHTDRDEDSGDLIVTTYGVRRLVLNVQIIANAKGTLGDSAWAWAEELQNSADDRVAAEKLAAAGLGFVEVGTILDISAIEQSQYIGRATFDATFEGSVAKTQDAKGPAVLRVIGSGDVEGDATPELTFDVEVEESP